MIGLETPSSRRYLALAGVPTVLAAPLVVFTLITIRWLEHAYPPDADSIGLPILGYAILIWPMTLFMLGFALRRYPGAVPLWAWQNGRLIRSILWTFLFLWAANASVFMLMEGIRGGFPATVIFWLIHIYILVLLRAAIVGKMDAEQQVP